MKQPNDPMRLTPVQIEWAKKIAQETMKITKKHDAEFTVSASSLISVMITLILEFKTKEDREVAYQEIIENLHRAYEKTKDSFL